MMLLQQTIRFSRRAFNSSVSQKNLPLPAIFAFLLSITLICGCEKKTPASAMALDESAQIPSVTKPEFQKVLIIHSYHPEYEWIQAVNRGINLVLSYIPNIQLQHFYMDTKRRTDPEWKQQVANEALNLIQTWQPDVIIACDDNAQDLVGRHLIGPGNPAWVFCGVNKEPQDYGYPAENVTGVLERLRLLETLEYFKSIQPQASKIVFLSDNSPTSQGTFDYAKEMLSTHPVDLEVIDWIMVDTLDEWKQAILKYRQSIDAFAVYTYHTIKAEAQSVQSVDPKEVMYWTTKNCSIPVIGFLIFTGDHGAFCGVYESGIEQGQKAAEMALKILEDTSPSQMPIITPEKGQTMINMRMARQLNIEVPESILKNASLIINEQEVSIDN